MKYAILTLLLILTDPVQIAKVNGLKKEAAKAYQSGNYQLAATKYSMLADTLAIDEDEVTLNLAHSQYKIGDTSSAKLNYARVSLSSDKKLKSVASQHLGVLAKESKKLEESLEYLKAALKADPTNAGAKYDYEVVKKLLNQQQQNEQNQDNNDQNKDDQNKEDQEKKDQEKKDEQSKDEKSEKDKGDKSKEDKDSKEKEDSKDAEEKEKSENGEQKEQGKEGEKSEEEKKQEMQDATKQKLEEMNMSEEKAKMILEALKNNEVQYIQQRKRQATERPDSGKPDW